MSDRHPSREHWLERLRLSALWALVVALVALAEPSRGWILAGLPFLVAGQGVRLWAAGHLVKSRKLVTSGPYRYTRNPLYLGRLLIFTGLCLMARLPRGAHWAVLLLGYVVFFGYYLPRKERIEPARLRALHGAAYERYLHHVPALWPRLRPYPEASPGRWSFARMRHNREHWMVLGLALVTLALTWKSVAG